MPFKKFRPLRQWGRFNVQLYKDMYSMRMRRKLPRFQVPQHLIDAGVDIHDPNDPDFPNTPRIRPLDAREKAKRALRHPAYYIPELNEYPHYHQTPCLLFDGSESLSAGLEQAANLTKTVLRNGLPDTLWRDNLVDRYRSDRIEEAIMDAFAHDGTLEELPPRPHELIFWRETEPRKVGITQKRAHTNLIRNLIRACMMSTFDSPKSLSDEQRRHLKTVRILDEAQINACVDIKDAQSSPLVMRVDDAIIMTSTETVPRVTDDKSVMETTHEPIVDIAPIDALIDAKQEHIYRTESFYPDVDVSRFEPFLAELPRRRYLHTIFTEHHHANLKYPWTDSEVQGKALLQAFAGAVAVAMQISRTSDRLSSAPVTTQVVQVCPDGYINMIVYQLCTLSLHDKQHGVKNVAFFDRERLFEPHAMWDEFVDVRQLNDKAYAKFAALLMHCASKK